MSALSDYAARCRRLKRTAGATERTYYPALEELLTACTADHVDAATEIATAGGQPDLALFAYKLPVLYVEVKCPPVNVKQLLGLRQARSYAQRIGGRVLLTNLNDFVLAELVNGNLQSLDYVRLFGNKPADVFAQNPTPTLDAEDKLRRLVGRGCAAVPNKYAPAMVAGVLAEYARALHDSAPEEAFQHIQAAFSDWLKAALDDKFLVSTTVQLVVYGIFATWLQSGAPDALEWQHVRDGLGDTAIAEIVYSALAPSVTQHWQVAATLSSIAEVLRRVDRDALAVDFDNNAIEYFYEPFLAAYDPNLRDRLGVWYTPQQIAAYQVARCDHHLKAHLHIDDGLADEGVIVLDPAAGTGTYLTAVYEHLHEAYQQQGHSPDQAAQKVREDAKNRIAGFDILPAALVIGDLHLRRVLGRLGAPLERGHRPALYLTNSLLGWFPDSFPPQGALPWAAAERESAAANRYKQKDRPVLVVLGNPPYEGYAKEPTDEEKKLREPWVQPLYSQWGIKKQRMSDLYILFWAMAARRVADLTGHGIVSFITNSKWLTGRSYPAMREGLLGAFDQIVVDDLGGDSRSSGTDGSIFSTSTSPGISVGTAITTSVRLRAGHDNSPASTTVHHRTLNGSGAAKRSTLDSYRGTGIDTDLTDLTDPAAAKRPSKQTRWKLTARVTADDWPPLADYFNYQNSGVHPVRILVVTDYSYDDLKARMDDYFNPNITWEELKARHPHRDPRKAGQSAFVDEQSRYNGPSVRQTLLNRNKQDDLTGCDPRRIVKCLWRPLDGRWLYWEPEHKLLDEACSSLIRFWDDEQVCLVTTAGWRRHSSARPLASTTVPIFHAMEPNTRVLPLWDPPRRDLGQILQTPRTHNLQQHWIDAAREAGTAGTDEQIAETIFYAICAVVASPQWLETQPEQYDDYPTVPVAADPSELASAARTGRQYAALVDPWIPVSGVTTGTIRPYLRGLADPDPVNSDPTLGFGVYGKWGGLIDNNDLLWAKTGPQDESQPVIAEGWRNIPPAIMDFELGGFKTIRKQLSYRLPYGFACNYGLPCHSANCPHHLLLTAADRQQVQGTARRIAAIHHLAADADAHFQTAAANQL